ncbi:MAG: LytTR family DNA-binding domain-containing protein [Erysipelotrichaceae bacterium]
MRVAIVDDTILIRLQISGSIKEYCERLKQPAYKVDEYENGDDFIEAKKNYDIVFLDIDMPGKDGIEVARRIREYDAKCYIVFVTGYDKRAEAFDVHAFGYIQKPYNKLHLIRMLQDINANISSCRNENTINFNTEQGDKILKVKDIIYFEYLGTVLSKRSVRIKCVTGSYTIRDQIGSISEKMALYGFANPHRSFLVNLAHVGSFKGYNVILSNGEIIPMSQKKAVYFKGKLTEYISEKVK